MSLYGPYLELSISRQPPLFQNIVSSFPPFLTSILTVENILVSDSPLCYNVPIGVTILGRRLPSYRGTEPSDYIETRSPGIQYERGDGYERLRAVIAGFDDAWNRHPHPDSIYRRKEITAQSLAKIGGYFF